MAAEQIVSELLREAILLVHHVEAVQILNAVPAQTGKATGKLAPVVVALQIGIGVR